MKLKRERAITLIALVITIIILLILAGITIATLGGENGLLAKVKKAKEAEIKAEMREELTLALHDLQIEKRAEATLDDVTQDWINGQIKKYECTVNDDASLSGKQVIMKKDKIRGKFLIDGNLNIVEEEYNESSIEFSYETREREGNKINIAIIIKDEINGIKEVQMPDGTIYPYNKKEQVGIDYSVELGVEYKVKITSESGEVVEKTIKIDDYYYKITKNIGEGLKIDNTAIKAAWNKPYQATITAEGYYIIDTIAVTMGGQVVAVDKTTGVINIDKVTDDIEIKATSSKNYGALVENYNVTYDSTEGASNAWRIFYSDGTNIYLIADDYIHYDYAPYKTTTNKIYKNNTDYRLSFNNVCKDYTESPSINSGFASKWLSLYWKNNSESTNTNIMAVAYMLDTSIWNTKFRNSEYADYAIGGPTLEMYCASYKDTHPTKYIECEAESNTNGYKVKWNSDSSYSTLISGLATSNDCNNIYIKSDTSKAYGMWLASPSAGNANDVMGAYFNGLVSYNNYHGYYNDYYPGLRPLVCLSSDIQLKKLDNGNYRIVKSTE